MKNYTACAQLFLRIALATGFIVADLDRWSMLGAPGSAAVTWGDWQHFISYTHKLLFFLSTDMVELLAIGASVAELLCGILLILGLFTRAAGFASGIVLLLFAIGMAVGLGIRAPISFSVFTASAGSFVLAAMPNYKWSIDALLNKRIEQLESVAIL